MSESFYAMRRTDGETMGDEWSWVNVDHADDWSHAVMEVEYGEQEIEFEIVLMTPTVVATRTFSAPRCAECGHIEANHVSHCLGSFDDPADAPKCECPTLQTAEQRRAAALADRLISKNVVES